MKQDAQTGPDGVLVVDKPSGITSHDVITRVRRILGIRRIGHIGTLDPIATGVLPLLVGRATRLASLLSEGDKIYSAVFLLGVVTDTYDVTGQPVPDVLRRTVGTNIDLETIEEVSRLFVGTFSQTPPPYSAKKIGGVRAYRLARGRRPVEPKPATVTVRELDIQELDGERLRCRVTCAPGFYVRSLAHDLGKALNCGACVDDLRRERNGPFGLDHAVTLDLIEREHQVAHQHILSMADLLPGLPSVVVTDRGSRLTSHGNALKTTDFEISSRHGVAGVEPSVSRSAPSYGKVKVYDRSGKLLAIAEGNTAGVLHPRIVLV